MEFALLAVLALGGFVGYRIGYSRGVKVNAPVGTSTPRPGLIPRDDIELR